MRMIVHTIKDLSNSYVINLLCDGLKKMQEQHLLENYHPDLKDHPANLFYILKNGRFAVGNYYVLENDDGEYAGSAGWNRLDDTTALALVRAYIPLKFRTTYNMAKFILPKIIEESKECQSVWITCNDYNKTIYDAFTNLSNGKSAGMFNQWPEDYKKFKPVGTKIVNNVLQFVAEYKRE
jgi:hypothetical protein